VVQAVTFGYLIYWLVLVGDCEAHYAAEFVIAVDQTPILFLEKRS